MARMANQKMKLLYLKDIFEKKTDEQHSITIETIIAELGKVGIHAERKSLYTDINILRGYGMDIIGRRSKQYEYYLGERNFEMPELKLLADAVSASNFITNSKSRQLIEKIESLTGENDASLLHRQVYAHRRSKCENETIYYNVDSIYNAIEKGVLIHFIYFEWNNKKQKQYKHNKKVYEISPWAMVWNNEYYYLVGYEAGEERVKNFRVDKMEKIELTEMESECGAEYQNFDMEDYTRKMFGMFNGNEESVQLECDNSLANIIIDRFGKDIPFFDCNDNSFGVCLNVSVSPVFLSWVIGFGDRMKVVSPKGVIHKIKEMAQGVTEQYAEG